jgi:hypothetical protein
MIAPVSLARASLVLPMKVPENKVDDQSTKFLAGHPPLSRSVLPLPTRESAAIPAFMFTVGDRVVRNPAAWIPSDFDAWGRGVGIGTVVTPPFPLDDLDSVDVAWPAGRCFERTDGLLPARPDRSAAD